ncbi:MAG TPA: DUF1993 domain-containing protein [Candidatus Binatia bacterium]|nr:DUF1993 domain-containing protein [Candidatus Binatia bacterium]
METSTTIAQFGKMLENLDRWLEVGVAYAKSKSFEPDVLAQARLAPDQYELVRQIQSACDAAKYAAAYLSGGTAPSHPDTEKTIDELRARIRTCLGYVRSVPASAYAGADDRRVAPAWLQGKWMRGDRYLTEVAIPNFYFHVAMAYAILRHNGVALGKMDYIGSLPLAE